MSAPALDNLLGALALGVVDSFTQEGDDLGALGASAAGAIVTINTWPRLSIGDLAQILGLSHPGTVRLVDRLQAQGLVSREPGQDARAVALALTREGQAFRQRLVQARSARLQEVLTVLSPAEQAVLSGLLMRLLRAMPQSVRAAYSICRLCDTERCTPHGCPVEQGCMDRMGILPGVR